VDVDRTFTFSIGTGSADPRLFFRDVPSGMAAHLAGDQSSVNPCHKLFFVLMMNNKVVMAIPDGTVIYICTVPQSLSGLQRSEKPCPFQKAPLGRSQGLVCRSAV
jgi:hypothetical protein